MYQSPAPTPSGRRSSTPAARAAPAVVTRSSPSAPRPRRRSHSAATAAGVSANAASRSANSTKSFSVPWPLANSTCSGYGPPHPQRRLRELRGIGRVTDVDPVNAVVAAKPRPLPAHIATSAEVGLLTRAQQRLPGGQATGRLVERRDHLGV